MGIVVEAFDPELDRRVALKLLRPRDATASSHARLLREAQAMARLSHPNVVQVYEVGALESQVFIAMELVAGRTLAEWQQSGEHDWREIVRLYLEAGRGLAAAHAAGLVHREHKPLPRKPAAGGTRNLTRATGSLAWCLQSGSAVRSWPRSSFGMVKTCSHGTVSIQTNKLRRNYGWIEAKGGNADAVVLLVISNDIDDPDGLCGYDPGGEHRLRTWQQLLLPNSVFGSICNDQGYAEYFAAAAAKIKAQCDVFVPQ